MPTIQDPISITSPIQVPDWEYDERRMEREAENKKGNEGPRVFMPELNPKPKILGTIRFTAHAVQDIGEAGLGIIDNLVGRGEFATAQTEAQDSPQKSTENKVPDQGEEKPRTLEELRFFFDKLNTDLASIMQQEQMGESIRITKRVVGGEDIQKAGTTKEHIFKTHVLHEIAQEDAEVIKKQDEQVEDTPIPSPAKQVYAVEGVFEGVSGKIGSGTGNLSAIGGAQ